LSFFSCSCHFLYIKSLSYILNHFLSLLMLASPDLTKVTLPFCTDIAFGYLSVSCSLSACG